MKTDISAIIVNYKTTDLTTMAIWSLHSLYPQLSIILIDNEADEISQEFFAKLQKKIPNFTYLPQLNNLHHGPGLDLGIRVAKTEYVLTFDSDCIAFRSGFLEPMCELMTSENDYLVGQLDYVNEKGKDIAKKQTGFFYTHPKCMLLRKSVYLSLPPFEIHGAPCLKNQKAATQKGYQIKEFPVKEFVYHIGRGTVDRFGYRLGWIEKIKSLFR